MKTERWSTTISLVAAWLAAAATVRAAHCTAPVSDWGPAAAVWREDERRHVRAAGPVWERVDQADRAFVALRPIYARAVDQVDGKTTCDYLWPLAGRRIFQGEQIDRVLIFWRQVDDIADPRSRRRTWLLPILFQGRDRAGARYRALFPLLGSIHEIFGLDRVFFVLFPLYSHSQKNDLDTHNFLWPIMSRTTGEGVYRFRIFPFFGVSRRDKAYQKRFVMWPVWTSVRYYYPHSHGGGYILFPLWGHLNLSDQESWWVLPPFFRFHRGEKLNLVYAPWPFFQWSSGDVDKLYLWPLWGRRSSKTVQSWFALWPIMWHWRIERTGRECRRLLVLPFLYHEEVRRTKLDSGSPDTGANRTGAVVVESRYWKLWPLISYRRQAAERRLRLLELWPLKDTPPVERSWARLWTIYEYRADGECAESELLWGIYRHQRRGRTSCYWSIFPLFDMERQRAGAGLLRWNILKGLLGYERRGNRCGLRLLYVIRLGG